MALVIYPKQKRKLGGLEKEMNFRGNVTWSKILNLSYRLIYFPSSAFFTSHSWVSAAYLDCLSLICTGIRTGS